MKLVLVHGRGQGGKNANELRVAWLTSLATGLTAAGLEALPTSTEVVLPFYGDLLDELTGSPPDFETVARGPDDIPDHFAASFLLEIAERAGVTDSDVRSEMSSDTVALGPQNWPWVLATGRALSRKAPWLGGYLVSRLTADVAAYLTRMDVQLAVNELIGPHISGDEQTIVVSHSLGTIIAYVNLIEHEGDSMVPLLVTLGSPLGIDVVKANLPRPLRRPASVGHWFNAADTRDPVALFPRLDRDSFPAEIENLSDVHNPRGTPHAIVGYLSDPLVAAKIANCLNS